MIQPKQKLVVFLLLCITYTISAQNYTSWDDVESKRFGKETIFTSRTDKKPLHGAYKISENSGAYADINFKNGKIDGLYVNYDFNSNKIAEATYKEGKIEGKQVSYFQNGNVQEETFYKNGLKEGTWLTYNRKGEKIREENYKNGNKEGKWLITKTYPDENTTSKVTEYYKNNEPTGHWEERLTDGKLKWEKVHSAPTNYIEKHYYPNGKLSSEVEVKDRRKNGLASYFTPEGLLQYKVNYNKDYIDYKEQYFENGVLKSKTSYKYGRIDGGYVRYNKDGIKIEEGVRKDTYKDGVWKIYEGRKGRLSCEITYKNGNENGPVKFYNTNAKKVEKEGQYLNGKKHGVWKHYDMAGELTKEEEYNKGKLVSEKRYN